MTITRATLYRYHLPLARTLLLRKQTFTSREGLLLRLDNANNHSGWGEIAPLPGFSSESFDDAATQAATILPVLREAHANGSTPANLTFESLDALDLHSSVRCGCEMALLHLAAEEVGKSVMSLLGGNAPSIALNGLLTGATDDILSDAARMSSQGYRTVKLKLGGRPLDEDVALVYRVYARVAGKARMRLDANRAWTLEQAVQFGKLVDVCPIEYIEEPLHSPEELPQLGQRWNLPIALDESLADCSPQELPQFERLQALVIKPTLMGGLKRAAAFAKCAQERGLRAVISSSFESGVGLSILAHMAAALAPDTPAGLDTGEWFKEGILERPLARVGGNLQLRPEMTLESDIRKSVLTEIAHA